MLVEHTNTVNAQRKQSGIWWSTTADQVTVDADMGCRAYVDGNLVTKNNSQIESKYNTSSHFIEYLHHFDSSTPNITFLDNTGSAEYNIIDTGGSSCNPSTYDLTCTVTN